MRVPPMVRLMLAVGCTGLAVGCGEMLDQDRASTQPIATTQPMAADQPPATAPAASAPATSEPAMSTPAMSAPATGELATGDLGQRQPLPGLEPPPKPFVAMGRHAPPPPPAQPSPLLLEHAAPDAPLPLSAYATQPVYRVDDFGLGSDLTGVALQQRLGPPAGVAGVEDPWLVYRVTNHRELWLHFADGDGPLLAADLVRGAENGYVRDRVYPR